MLTIISCFYNSEKKCSRLLDTLAKLAEDDVELVFVDDGSTDNTLMLLHDFKLRSNLYVQVVSQANQGPGAARNAGLQLANGNYVWFVDSDDNIKLEAIRILREKQGYGFDFIDFDHDSEQGPINSMALPEGIYDDPVEVRSLLLRKFGMIFAKIIRKNLIVDNKIYYPIYCYYEDNSLVFVYPFHVRNFYKSEVVAYSHHEEYESITRSVSGFRYFDRMNTAIYGLKKGSLYAVDQAERDILNDKFIRLYLLGTVGQLITRKPGKSWVVSCRVMHRYREVALTHGIPLKIPLTLMSGSMKFKIVFSLLWFSSYLLKSQRLYFERLRIKAWGKSFPI